MSNAVLHQPFGSIALQQVLPERIGPEATDQGRDWRLRHLPVVHPDQDPR